MLYLNIPFTAGLGLCAVVPLGIVIEPVELQVGFWRLSMLNAFAPPVCRVRFAVPSDVLINAVIVVEFPACTSIVLGMVYAV